jgi:hypothetical protein
LQISTDTEPIFGLTTHYQQVIPFDEAELFLVWNFPGVAEPSMVTLQTLTYEEAVTVSTLARAVYNSYGFSYPGDFKTDRQAINTFYAPTENWNEMKLLPKRACARFFLVDKTQRLSVLTAEEEQKAADFYDESMRKSRETRLYKALSLLHNSLNNLEAKTVKQRLLQDNLQVKYISGLESKAQDGTPGLLDYLQSSDVYTGDGLLETSYVPVVQDLTLATLISQLVSLLVN